MLAQYVGILRTTRPETSEEMMKSIFIEEDLSSFEDFHDGRWLEKVAGLVKGTNIDTVVEEFATHWWGSARAFVLPWLLVNGVYNAVNSIIPVKSSRQDLWSEYLENDSFRIALWKLSEGMYCSIYYAYENLIVNLVGEIGGVRVRVTDRDFNKALIGVYGEEFANRIWNSNFISVSREVRNCIVHNGGKPSSKLSKMNPLPLIRDGDILISASDTRQLYNTLKPIVHEIIEKSLSKS